jgi:MazG family protein
MENFNELLKVIEKLRNPDGGCPWDLEQTHESLLKYLLEESNEYIHAVMVNEPTQMEEELGDVLLQVLLHCQIASESKKFDLESVSKVLSQKMIRRHPHVFGENKSSISTEEVKENWEQIKAREKKESKKFYIDEKDNIYTALQSAYKIGNKTSKVNFDWDNEYEVLDKVQEELDELSVEIKNQHKENISEELGDLLFSVAQLSRHLGEDPELILKKANKKFTDRFNKIEQKVAKTNISIEQTTREQLESFWIEVKNER